MQISLKFNNIVTLKILKTNILKVNNTTCYLIFELVGVDPLFPFFSLKYVK